MKPAATTHRPNPRFFIDVAVFIHASFSGLSA